MSHMDILKELKTEGIANPQALMREDPGLSEEHQGGPGDWRSVSRGKVVIEVRR